MDPQLFDRLPSGGTWWNVAAECAPSWMQTSYEAPVAPPPRPAVAASVAPKKPWEGKAVGERDLMTPVWKRVLQAIDPYCSLYTKDQERDAIDTVRVRLLAFVTGLAHPYFGPKKSRILSMWLSNNRVEANNAGIIQEFLSFLLEDRAADWQVCQGPRFEWYVKN
jgi:hypothetical protein